MEQKQLSLSFPPPSLSLSLSLSFSVHMLPVEPELWTSMCRILHLKFCGWGHPVHNIRWLNRKCD